MRTTKGTSRWLAAVASASMVVALAGPAVAADPVPYDEQAVHHSLFAAVVQVREGGTRGLIDAVLAAELSDWRAAHPAADVAALNAHLTAVSTLVGQAVKASDESPGKLHLLGAAMEKLAGSSEARLGGPAVKGLLRSTTGEELAGIVPPIEQVRSATQEYLWEMLSRGALADVWGTLHARAATDPALAEVWNTAFGARLGVRLDTPAEDLAQLPDLSGSLNLSAITAKRHDKDAYRAEIQSQLDVALAALRDRTAAAVTDVVAQSDRFPVDGPNKPTSADEAAAKEKAEADRKLNEKLGQAVTVLGKLAGMVDKQFGKQIETIAKAVVGAISAITTYTAAISAAGITAAAMAMSTLTLVGGLVGAAMILLPLFSSGGGADGTTGAEIAALRDQINRMAAGMDKRFDRIEKMLGTMYDGLSAQLTALSRDLAEVRAQLTVIAGQLIVLDQRVDSLALASQAAFEQIIQQPLKTSVDRYVHREARTGTTIDSFATYFDQADSPTRTFAADSAKQAPYVVPTGTSLADPVATVGLYLPAGAIDYLAQWAGARGIALTPAPGDQPASGVANPSAWLLGARANLILQLQNPQYAAQVNEAETQSTIAAGDAVNRRVRQFSAPAADGATNALFQRLTADYRAAMGQWKAGLDEVGRAVRWVETDRDYNMWGSVDQDIPAAGRIADVPNMARCGSTTGVYLNTPSKLNRSALPNVYHLANYAMALGYRPELRSCLDAQFVDVEVNDGPRYQQTNGDLELVVRQQAKWVGGDWQDVRTVTWKTHLVDICLWSQRSNPPTGYCRDTDYYLNDKWNSTYRAKLDSNGVVVDNPAALALARTKAAAMLTGKQRYFYRVAALGTGVDRPPAGSWSPSQQLWDAGKKVSDTVRMLQIFSDLGWSSALERDDVLRGQLFGDRSLPADYRLPRSQDSYNTGSLHLYNAYQRALANYGSCKQQVDWDPCQGDVSGLSPLAQQERFGAGCVAAPAGQAPDDPLGSCVIQAGSAASGILADRYGYWSGQIKAGTHQEGLAAVKGVVGLLRATNIAVHAG
ncbi:hypothetical protein DFJ67_7164 [Asanoa ferruginea]|uniref:Uncharacterized protein n=1 Tax=Asanoa ferruginea TaxID=53367 RepID=A0A3D9ZUQ0_9ACTN|nr:hypothetical protein [Asanoa ferruginea]REG01089.1 hypothetical protein DFJ67_7164 [Asanoa ferruginea]GIF47212.1 hypothetical protein Afe04nite_17510 [Asanoa ferruginea]